MKTTTSA